MPKEPAFKYASVVLTIGSTCQWALFHIFDSGIRVYVLLDRDFANLDVLLEFERVNDALLHHVRWAQSSSTYKRLSTALIALFRLLPRSMCGKLYCTAVNVGASLRV